MAFFFFLFFCDICGRVCYVFFYFGGSFLGEFDAGIKKKSIFFRLIKNE